MQSLSHIQRHTFECKEKKRAIRHQFSFPFLIDPTQRFTTIQTGRESKRSTQSSCHKMMHRPSSNSRPVPLTELKAYKPLSHVHAHICSCTQTYMLTQICRYMRERVVDGCVCGCVEVDREFFIFWHLIFSTHTHAARSTQSTATHTLVHTGNNTYAHTTVYICMFICTSMHVCVCAKDNETLTHSHSLSHTHDKSMHHHLVLLPQSVTSLDFDLFSSPDAMAYFQPCLEDKNVGGQKIRNSSATCFQLSLACF